MSDIRRFAFFLNTSGQHVGEAVPLQNDPEIFEMTIPKGVAGVEFFDRDPKGAKPIDKINFVSDIFSQDRASDYSEAYARNLKQRNMAVGLLLMNGPGTNRLLTPIPGEKYFVLNSTREFIMPADCRVAPTVEERNVENEAEPATAFRRAVEPPPVLRREDFPEIAPGLEEVREEMPLEKKPKLPPSMIRIPN